MRIFKLTITALSILSTALIFNGCGSDSRTGRNDYNTNFRFINAVSDSATDLYLDEQEYQLNVQYLESTGYSEEETGAHRLQVLVSGSGNRLVDIAGSFADAQDQTLLVFGRKADSDFVLLRDNNEPSSDQTAKIRVINASSSNRRVDAYLLKSGTSIINEEPSLERFSYRQVSTYIALPEGQYDFTATTTDTKNELTANSVTLNGGSVYTILLTDAPGGGQPPRFINFKDL